MRVVGADEVHLMPLHALESHPNIRLDVFHDVPDVKRSVCVGQGGGDENAALFHYMAGTWGVGIVTNRYVLPSVRPRAARPYRRQQHSRGPIMPPYPKH